MFENRQKNMLQIRGHASKSLSRAILAGFLLALPLSLAGCEDDPVAPPPVKKKKRAAKKKTVEPDVGLSPEDAEKLKEEALAYSYNPVGKRDPFIPFIRPSEEADNSGREVGPLQKYDLGQYSLVGIVWGERDPMALVEDPEKNGHFVSEGTIIGKNWGKVARINPDSIVVAEEYRDFQGRLVVNEIVVELPVL